MTGRAVTPPDGHVLVTGGGSGIGAATVRALAALGIRVSVVDRVSAAAVDWWAALDDRVRGSWTATDVTDEAAMASVVAEVADISGVVTCAGISIKEPFTGSSDAAWTSTLELNVVASARAARLAAAAMIEAGRPGAVVFVSSTGASGYVEGLGAHYHASKGAVSAMTRSIAAELAPHRIRVNAVAPGTVRTPMTAMMRARLGEEGIAARMPLGRLVEPEDVADVIVFLLGPDSAMTTGHVVPVDGGLLAVAGRPLSGFTPRLLGATAPHVRQGQRHDR